MNITSRAILQTVLASDTSIGGNERVALDALLSGKPLPATQPPKATSGPLLITQKEAARMLSISRVTLWRLTRQGAFHPVEIIPGTVRYLIEEVLAFAKAGWAGRLPSRKGEAQI